MNLESQVLELHPGKMTTGTFEFEKEDTMIANEHIDKFLGALNINDLVIMDIPPRVLLRDFYKSLNLDKKESTFKFNLNQVVTVGGIYSSATVIARTQHSNGNNTYCVTYIERANPGNLINQWIREDGIEGE